MSLALSPLEIRSLISVMLECNALDKVAGSVAKHVPPTDQRGI